jgi:hypothetical protein
MTALPCGLAAGLIEVLEERYEWRCAMREVTHGSDLDSQQRGEKWRSGHHDLIIIPDQLFFEMAIVCELVGRGRQLPAR